MLAVDNADNDSRAAARAGSCARYGLDLADRVRSHRPAWRTATACSAQPTTFVIDQQGRIAWQHAGRICTPPDRARAASAAEGLTAPPAGSLAAMKVVSVVGNRPQFIKAAPLAAALAQGVRPRPGAHRPALRRRAVPDLLRRARAAPARPRDRGRVGQPRRPDRRDAGGARAGARRRAARPGARLRRHELDARRVARRREAAAPARPRRVGPALVRPGDARGGEPGRGRRPLRPALLPQPDGGREPGRRGDHARACTWSAT